MLNIIRFSPRWFGLQNAWTNIILTDNRGHTLKFRSERKAQRHANKLTRDMNNLIDALEEDRRNANV